jgi:hypothetical protein
MTTCNPRERHLGIIIAWEAYIPRQPPPHAASVLAHTPPSQRCVFVQLHCEACSFSTSTLQLSASDALD